MPRRLFHMMYVLLGLLGIVVLLVLGFLFIGKQPSIAGHDYGMTFSRVYARDDLKLDPNAVLDAAIHDLHIDRFRIPVYWKFVEPTKGEWDFTDIDHDIKTVTGNGAYVVIALGEKVPRWPECWTPDWWKKLPTDQQQAETLNYLQTIVERYRDNPRVIGWQVENEPHFEYGDCPKTDPDFHRQEIALVRKVDPYRHVYTTDSGELSLWTSFGSSIDQLGVSVYRVVRSPLFGTWSYWFLPPGFYKAKADLLRPFGVPPIYVSEFQMEPWNNKPLLDTPIDDQLKTFDINRMRANIQFAKHMGISTIDFWGVEWWYWMKTTQKHPEFWEEAKTIWAHGIDPNL